MSNHEIAGLKEQIEQLREQLIEAEQMLQAAQKQTLPATGLIRLDEAHIHHRCAQEDFNPEVLMQHGWEAALSDLVKPSPYISILKATSSAAGRIELLVLFPTASSTPIHVDVSDCASVSAL